MYETAMWGVIKIVVGAVGIVVYAEFVILIMLAIISVLEAFEK